MKCADTNRQAAVGSFCAGAVAWNALERLGTPWNALERCGTRRKIREHLRGLGPGTSRNALEHCGTPQPEPATRNQQLATKQDQLRPPARVGNSGKPWGTAHLHIGLSKNDTAAPLRRAQSRRGASAPHP